MNRNNLCRLQQPDHQPSDGADDHAAAEYYCCPVIDKGLWRNNPNMTSTPEQGATNPGIGMMASLPVRKKASYFTWVKEKQEQLRSNKLGLYDSVFKNDQFLGARAPL